MCTLEQRAATVQARPAGFSLEIACFELMASVRSVCVFLLASVLALVSTSCVDCSQLAAAAAAAVLLRTDSCLLMDEYRAPPVHALS